MESCFLSVLGRPNTKLPWSIKHRKGNVMANTLLTMLRQLAFQHWLIILATSRLRFGQTFFHLRVFLNEVLPFSKYLEISLGFLICESSHLTPFSWKFHQAMKVIERPWKMPHWGSFFCTVSPFRMDFFLITSTASWTLVRTTVTISLQGHQKIF